MKFIDEAKIQVRSGDGGDGKVSFLRAKFVPEGGPNGGSGGRGGDVYLYADPQLGTLLDYKYVPKHKAENGQPGGIKQMTGRSAKPLRIPVPVGTIITDADTGEVVADLDGPGQEVLLCHGGKGGRGNMSYASSTNQAPRDFEHGHPGEVMNLELTLKLIADVGLVGFPNAGKSTLISRLSAARPKVAGYPFTTLTPNLGIVRTSGSHSFVMADIPGLIEGAADGAGLGHQFLRHVERVSVLAFLLDVSPEPRRHPLTDYEALVGELTKYAAHLADKPRVIVLTKSDLPDTEAALEEIEALAEAEGWPFFLVSSVRGDGLDALAYCLQDVIDRASKDAAATEAAPT